MKKNQKNLNLIKEYKIKKIFITGAGGLVGTELTNTLASLNYEIYANDINFSYKILKLKKITLLKYNFLNSKFPKIEKNIDIFIHNSAVTKSKNKKSQVDLYKTNIRLTKKALLFAKKLKIKKFFLISSTSVYRGFIRPKYSERSTTVGKESYSASKLVGEEICKEFCYKNKIKFSVLRIGNIYSGFEKTKWSRANISIMQQWLNSFENKVLLKTNSFDTLRDWTYLNDIPHAIHSIIKHNNNFKILNLVSPFILSDFDIMKTITKKINLLKSLNKKTRHNAAYSIYINKIKFKNWTSPQRAINLIRNLNEKN